MQPLGDPFDESRYNLVVNQNPVDLFLKEIEKANTVTELESAMEECDLHSLEDTRVVFAIIKKQKLLHEKERSELEEQRLTQQKLTVKLTKKCNDLRATIGTIIGPDGTELTDHDFQTRITLQIPANTYTQLKVSTIAQYQFVNNTLRARKIELIREEWGFICIPLFFESIGAFFSAMCEKKSIYREVINHNTLMKGILASSIIKGDQNKKNQFEAQMRAAYWCGKSIVIYVPFDFSENGVITITTASSLLSWQIESGKWLRSLFTDS